MYPDIIAIGIPFLIACVVIEFIYDMRRKVSNYRLNGAISNISCGIFEQVTGFISKGLFAVLYLYIHENWRLATLEDTFLVWIALIVLVDLVFYFFHRLSHRCSFLWSGHVVHHEVDEFNLTVALRRSVMQEFTITWFYLPFAFAGFSPGAFFLVFAAHNLYQFLIHTRYLPELRIFGLAFNTPHHHEIHHCRNACYIDKNFAGVFIIWDKLFGTFAEHVEEPEFGVSHLTTTLNPVKAQITTFARVMEETRRRRGLWQKMNAFFGPPSYLAFGYGQPEAKEEELRARRPKFDPRVSSAAFKFTVLCFVGLVIGTTVYRNFEEVLSTPEKLIAMTVVTLLLFYIGNLLDGRRWKGAAQPSPNTRN